MTPRAQRRLINEVKKQSRMTAKDLKASLELANISVHESTIRKTLNKQGIYGRTPRRKPLLTKKNIAARLKFAKEHIDTPQRYWQHVLWIDETKIELFDKNTQHYIWLNYCKYYQINCHKTIFQAISAPYHKQCQKFTAYHDVLQATRLCGWQEGQTAVPDG
uniref:Transposase Tc1-like domain-containing protein n=1 Tax=Sander lucioperca TaxID=283035 RepID=A0A8D0AL45_SANLU